MKSRLFWQTIVELKLRIFTKCKEMSDCKILNAPISDWHSLTTLTTKVNCFLTTVWTWQSLFNVRIKLIFNCWATLQYEKSKFLFSIVMTNPVLCARPIYYTTTKGEGAQHMLLKQQHRVHSLSVAASQLCCPKV